MLLSVEVYLMRSGTAIGLFRPTSVLYKVYPCLKFGEVDGNF